MLPRSFALILAAALAACSSPRPPHPPTADFLLVAGDSTYWITTGRTGFRVRGAPLLLANYGGRFRELYVADDDHSYYDALLVGQHVYARDLITDDSTEVYADTLVSRIAAEYAAAHPDDSELDPDDPVADRPSVSATSEISLLDVYGPYLSIEYHADTRHRPRPPFHTTWRTVIDLRVGHPVPVESLVGTVRAQEVAQEGRRSYEEVMDSARARQGDLGELMRTVLTQVSFDPASYSLTHVGRRPAIAFAARIAGRRDAEQALPLQPIAVDSEAWWGPIVPTLPIDSAGDDVRWNGNGYAVVASAASVDSVADIAIVDSARHRWHVAWVHIPVRRVFWLDHPRVDSTTRRALDRAFNDAALYDENAHVASTRPAASAIVSAARYLHPAPRADVRRAAHRRLPNP